MNLTKSEFGYTQNLIFFLLIVALTMEVITCCGPGRSGGRHRTAKKLKPLVFKQHVPNYAEKTLGASGPQEGRINRSDPRFKSLVPNYNSDIIFKDDEGTGEDRLMTQRCKERLNTLAVSVMNLWPGVRIRVIESWDSEGTHHPESLHYEGRAVDITTSDRDNSKYGMLARLAVEAGFDWVYYESRTHVHCSVKSESSQAAKSLGCFNANDTVMLDTGVRKLMSRLEIGDRVLTLNSDGNLEYSPVLMFMHHSPKQVSRFLKITMHSGTDITITATHLILKWQKPNATMLHDAIPVYAKDVSVNDQLLMHGNKSGQQLFVDRIIKIEAVHQTGVYAPLTETGTIVVNDVVASCYAVIYSQRLAHLAFAPIRVFNSVATSFNNFYDIMTKAVKTKSQNSTLALKQTRHAPQPQDGIHWYCRFLQGIADYTVPSSFFSSE